jgi:hypothetical protein
MAQVATGVSERIELVLNISLEAWKGLPEAEATIDEWDLIDQIVYIEEWPLEEERLRELAEYRAEGAMSLEQKRRHDELLSVVEQNRPIIRRLQQT